MSAEMIMLTIFLLLFFGLPLITIILVGFIDMCSGGDFTRGYNELGAYIMCMILSFFINVGIGYYIIW